MERVHRIKGWEGDCELAEALDEARRLRDVLEQLKSLIVHRALVSWDRSTETFGDEIIALNDVNQALRDLP